MDAITAIRTRRSVRVFLDTPLDRATIEALLGDAAHAPFTPIAQSGAWHFTVIRGRERLAGYGDRALAFAEAVAARLAALGETNAWGDAELDALRRDQRRIEHGLLAFTAGQKAESAMILFVGHGGEIEAKAIRTKRASKPTATGAAGEKPDYSGAMIETLSRIKTLAVQEAVAGNPALALDILLDCLAGQIVHDDPAYHSPLSLRLDGFNAAVPDDMIAGCDIAGVAELGAADFAMLPERDRFAFIQAMDTEAKGRLLALLVASQIDGGQASGTRRDTRHRRFERIAAASGVDMAAKWQAPIAFFERLNKPVILMIMTEELGQAAADNCAKLKKGDLALAAAERMAGRGWLPQPLRIGEPELEVDTGASDELPDFEQDEAARPANFATRSFLRAGSRTG